MEINKQKLLVNDEIDRLKKGRNFEVKFDFFREFYDIFFAAPSMMYYVMMENSKLMMRKEVSYENLNF